MGRSRLHCLGDPPPPEVVREKKPHTYNASAVQYQKPIEHDLRGMIRPMLAWKWPKHHTFEEWIRMIPFPLMCTPKIDGIRCITQNDNVLPEGFQCWPTTRSLKEIPNEYIRKCLGEQCPPFLDGELTVGNTFQASTSGIMSFAGRPEFTYWVFDGIINEWAFAYEHRVQMLSQLKLPDFVKVLKPVIVNNPEELAAYEEDCILKGAEGVCARPPNSPYYHKRSHKTRPYLIAFKRFTDAEALCVGLEPLYSNQNTPERNALGYQERSSHQGGMVEKPLVGALRCRDLKTGVEFKLGTGFDQATRAYWHEHPDFIVGSIVKYKYQEHGVKDRPRIPTFIGIRDRRDLDVVGPHQQRTLDL